jgi:hypothetical protein
MRGLNIGVEQSHKKKNERQRRRNGNKNTIDLDIPGYKLGCGSIEFGGRDDAEKVNMNEIHFDLRNNETRDSL